MPVIPERSKHALRSRSQSIKHAIELLESRVLLSGTLNPSSTLIGNLQALRLLTTLATYKDTTLVEPDTGFTVDPFGNVWGTGISIVNSGSVNEVATNVLFEVPAGTGTISFVFNYLGSGDDGGIYSDSAGNIYGTEQYGGAFKDGLLFEIPAGTTSEVDLASFTATNGGKVPVGNLFAGPDGCLYGTTEGVVYSSSTTETTTVFKYNLSSGSLTTVASNAVDITGLSGNPPKLGALVCDTNGNVFTTTVGSNTISEIVAGSGQYSPFATFNPVVSGETLDGSLAIDPAGNIYAGTSSSTGGGVYEMTAGTSTFTTLFSTPPSSASTGEMGVLNGTTNLLIDPAGNLYGISRGDSIFEIQAKTQTISVVQEIGGSEYAGFAVYSQGNLFDDNSGEVDEISAVSAAQLSISSSAFKTEPGVAVTLNATVTGNIGTPTGQVTFFDNGTAIGSPIDLDSTGAVTLSVDDLPSGSNSITATYSGDLTYPEISSATNFAIQVGGTQPVAFTTATSTTEVGLGFPVTLTASLTGGLGIPTGIVQFFDNTAPISTAVTVDATGTATLVTSNLTLGANVITATYSGDADYVSLLAQPALTITVDNSTVPPPVSTTGTEPTTVALSYTASTTVVAVGESVNLSAVVSSTGGIPTGNATFFDSGPQLPGGLNLGTVSLDGTGTASLPTTQLPLGISTIDVHYLGDNTFAGGWNATNLIVNVVPPPTVSLAVSAATLLIGQPYSLTVQLTSTGVVYRPTGTVTFYNGATPIGTAAVDANGAAILTQTVQSPGIESFSSVYSGDGTFVSANSNSTASTFLTPSQIVPTLVRAIVPVTGIAGEPFKSSVVVKFNNSSASLTGAYQFDLVIDKDPIGLDAAPVTLASTVFKHLVFKKGKVLSLAFRTKTLPLALENLTDYYLAVRVTDPLKMINFITVAKPTLVSTPYVSLTAAIPTAKVVTVKAGGISGITLILTNGGNVAALGLFKFSVVLSTDGSTPLPYSFVVPSRKLNIKPGKSLRVSLRFRIGSSIPVGVYIPLVDSTFNDSIVTAAGNSLIVKKSK